MAGPLPPVVAVITANISGFSAELGKLKGEMSAATHHGSAAFEGMAGLGKMAFLGIGAAAVGVGVVSLKMAGDYQDAITQLITGGGEFLSNEKLISDGILKMSGEVGMSALALAKGIYNVDSAGFHGAASLVVLRAAAEGARTGNADLATVTNGLTSALNAYNLPASAATKITSEMVAAVGAGKMHMGDFSASLGTILPVAAALNVPFEQITGALSTMTMQTGDAATGATSLRFLLSALAGPTAAAAKEMKGLGVGEAEIPGITAGVSKSLKDLGLHTSEVADKLAHGDLPGALQMITDAIGKKFPAGSAEYEAALKGAVGGTRGMTAALLITGPHAAAFHQNIKDISGAAVQAGGHVRMWSEVQGDFNFKLDQARFGAEAMATALGLKLIPYAIKAMDAVGKFGTYLLAHKDILGIIAVAIGGPLVVAMLAFIVTLVASAVAFALSPFGLMLIAVALLSVGILLLVTHWGTVVAFLKSEWLTITGAVVGVFHGIINAVTGFVSHIINEIHGRLVGGFYAVLNRLNLAPEIFEKGIGAALPILVRIMIDNVLGHLQDFIISGLKPIVAFVTKAEALWATFSARPGFWVGKLVGEVIAHFIMLGVNLAGWLGDTETKWVAWLSNFVQNGILFFARLPKEILIATLTGWANIIGWMADTETKWIGWLSSTITDAVVAFARLPKEILVWLLTTEGNFLGWFASLLPKVVNAANGIAVGIATEIGKLPALMGSIANDIVVGLINGIKNMGGWAIKQVQGFGSGLLTGLKDGLGIHSPSVLFAEQVGGPIAQGIAQGIKDGAHHVKGALGSLTGNMVGVSVSGISPGGFMQPVGISSGGGMGSPSFTYNITMQGQPQTLLDQMQALLDTNNRDLVATLRAG